MMRDTGHLSTGGIRDEETIRRINRNGWRQRADARAVRVRDGSLGPLASGLREDESAEKHEFP